MQTVQTVSELRQALMPSRMAGKSIGVVPTMGALHVGHSSLIEASVSNNDITMLTLFVNPTQFNDPADFKKYPRTTERDLEIAESAGVDFVFMPEPSEIYPDGFVTVVSVPGLSDILEGASRPGHFNGVATVVAKLLNIVQADRAYFGQKDYQQLQIVKRSTADLDIPTEIITCPTVREPDGLAMSSRNVRLTPEQRQAAVVISKALFSALESFESGETNPSVLEEQIREMISAEELADLDYAKVVDPSSLSKLTSIDSNVGAVALVAAKFGDVRLIDNIILK